MRPKQVRINAYSLDGKEIQTDATGLLARCVQHELDHLDGVLFPDRMSPRRAADIAEGLRRIRVRIQKPSRDRRRAQRRGNCEAVGRVGGDATRN